MTVTFCVLRGKHHSPVLDGDGQVDRDMYGCCDGGVSGWVFGGLCSDYE